MENLARKKIKKEANYLKKLYEKFGRVNHNFQKLLTKRGYELWELGSGGKSYTCSGDIGEKHFAYSNEKYFGIGIHNIAREKCSNGYGAIIYRAWVKLIIE